MGIRNAYTNRIFSRVYARRMRERAMLLGKTENECLQRKQIGTSKY